MLSGGLTKRNVSLIQSHAQTFKIKVFFRNVLFCTVASFELALKSVSDSSQVPVVFGCS